MLTGPAKVVLPYTEVNNVEEELLPRRTGPLSVLLPRDKNGEPVALAVEPRPEMVSVCESVKPEVPPSKTTMPPVNPGPNTPPTEMVSTPDSCAVPEITVPPETNVSGAGNTEAA